MSAKEESKDKDSKGSSRSEKSSSSSRSSSSSSRSDRDRDREKSDRGGERERERSDRGGGDKGGERSDRDRGGDRERSDRDRDRGGERRPRTPERSSRDGGGGGGDGGSSRKRERSPRSSTSRRSGSPYGQRRRVSSSPSRSPPPRRQKKSTQWDVIPTGEAAIAFAKEQADKAAGIAPPNPWARKIFVGNLPAKITEKELEEFFSKALIDAQMNTSDQKPVVGVEIQFGKNYCFVEFRSMEEASSGMSFDGVKLYGNILKVRRPKDYVPDYSYSSITAAPAGIYSSLHLGDSNPNKIYIGNIPQNLGEEQIKELLTPFGALKSFQLAKDLMLGQSRGYAFCEFVDDKMADPMIETMNGLPVGEKCLVVHRANAAPSSSSSSSSLGGFSSGSSRDGQTGEDAMKTPGYSISPALNAGSILNLNIPAANLFQATAKSSTPARKSSVLLLVNMATLSQVEDEDEYAGLMEDVKEECEKHGPVLQVVIPRRRNLEPPQQEGDENYDDGGMDDRLGANVPFDYGADSSLNKGKQTTTQAIVPIGSFDSSSEFRKKMEALPDKNAQHKICPMAKVYVEFKNPDDCESALRSLAGRKYAGHVVLGCTFPDYLFKTGILY